MRRKSIRYLNALAGKNVIRKYLYLFDLDYTNRQQINVAMHVYVICFIIIIFSKNIIKCWLAHVTRDYVDDVLSYF